MKRLLIVASFLVFCFSCTVKMTPQQMIDLGNSMIERADYWEYRHMPFESDTFLSYWFRADVLPATMRWRGLQLKMEGQRQLRIGQYAPAYDHAYEAYLNDPIGGAAHSKKIEEQMKRYQKK